MTHILAETPWWVYILFVGLVIIGLKATRPRTISFTRLLLLPSIFTILSIIWLTERLAGNYFFLLFWILGLGAGSLLGWQSVRPWRIKPDRHRKTISLPGTRSTLILILFVFAFRYFFIYNYEVHPEIASHFFLADSILSGVVTGIFIGRSLELYQKYKQG